MGALGRWSIAARTGALIRGESCRVLYVALALVVSVHKKRPLVAHRNSGRLSSIYLATVIYAVESEERNLLCVGAHSADGPSARNKASARSSGNDNASFPQTTLFVFNTELVFQYAVAQACSTQ
jgi:hypothetical protein